MVFLGDLPFSSHLTIEINLTGRKTISKKKRSFIYDFNRQRTVCSFGSISTDVSKTAHGAL